jgi:hypothetical protein
MENFIKSPPRPGRVNRSSKTDSDKSPPDAEKQTTSGELVMGKRNYTHVQVLLPEIKSMLAKGKHSRKLKSTTVFRISRW